MQILVFEDEFGYILEPYSDEDLPTYWVSPFGTQRLWDAYWVPYDMPRVSRYLFTHLWGLGEIRQWEHRPVGEHLPTNPPTPE